ncbi:hypothetical protein ACHAQI_008188 [Fusarium lateritium]
MDKSKTRPLKSIHLKSRPLTTHALAWSCDAELAVATDDTIYIFLPEYPRTSGPDDGAEDDELQSQYTLSYRASGLIRPDPTLNAQLCSFSGIRVAGPPANDENWFPGVGSGLVTGSGAPICQIVRLEWSPNGLGCNLRPILTALSTSGCIYAVGEHIDRQSAMISGMRTRGFKAWKTLWGLGAQLPLPDPNEEDGYRNMNERIQSFSWAKEVGAGRGLLAYCNDVEEVAVMAVQLFSRPKEDELPSEETIWDIQEVTRFDGRGRHTKEDALDITDPDYVPHGSAFSLKWSPWLNLEGKQVAILAYLAKNHVGFRKVTIAEEWNRGQPPKIEVEKTDMTAICMFLSTDSYIEWEDQIVYDDDKPIARGVIATPFDVKPFQVSFLDCDNEPAGAHYTWECSTTYSKEDELVSSNPISGLMIHDQGATTTGPIPYYSIVRLSAMMRNQDWFQTNLPDEEATVPKWAERIRRHTTRLVPRSVALEGLDSDSDDSEDDFMDEDTTQLQVPESRYRIWGLAHSPGGGTTAVLVSRYSTQHPERRALCKLMFSRRDEERGAEGGTVVPSKQLTTEGQVWEWMYGNGPEVLGTTITSKISPELHNSPLREQFRSIAAMQQCVFCDTALHLEEDEAKCENGHLFARCASTGLAIMAPDISRICAVCELRCLKVAELSRVAEEHFGPGTRVESSDEVCGGCADDADFVSSIGSKPFVFIVGHERREYHIYKDMIARLSPALSALVNGPMREAQEGRVEWPDLDVDTFVRFAKFAFYADYVEAEPVLSEEPPPSPTRPGVTSSTEDLLLLMGSWNASGRNICRGSNNSETSNDRTGSDSSCESNYLGSTECSCTDCKTSNIKGLTSSNPCKSSSALKRSREREELRGAPISDWIVLYKLWLRKGSPPHCCGKTKFDQTIAHKRWTRIQQCKVPMRVQCDWQKTYEFMKDFAHCPSDDYYSKQQVKDWSLAVERDENFNPDVSYLPVLLTHVRVYIIADKYGVDELCRLSLYRLRLLLRGIVLFRKRILDLVIVVDEIFENTVEGDGARELIVKYFACYIEVMQDTPEVAELLRDGGDFVAALVEKMTRRL